MKKVLHVLAIKPVGGVGSFLKSIYEEEVPYQFDIVESGREIGGVFDSFFQKRGSKIVLFPEIKYQNIGRYLACCKQFYQKYAKDYEAIHVHSTAVAFFHLYFAKKYGIATRIFHAHSDVPKGRVWKEIENRFFFAQIQRYANVFFACGRRAGERIFEGRPFDVVRNGIDVERFGFSLLKRKEMRKTLGLQEEVAVGMVGRMTEIKNHGFFLKVAKALEKEKNFRFFCLGGGELLGSYKEMAKNLGLEQVEFLGQQSKLEDYYPALDVLLLPSKREGFSLVALEGQCCGLPILFSAALDSDMKLLEESCFLPIQEGDELLWKEKLQGLSLSLSKRYQAKEKVRVCYGKEETRNALMKLYQKYMDKEERGHGKTK